MHKNYFFNLLYSFLFFCSLSNAQNSGVKAINNDSIMEKSIRRIIENAAVSTEDIPEDLKTYSFLFVINYDSSRNGIITVTIDTFFDNKLDLGEKRLLYRNIVSDSAKYRKVISAYHSSSSLSVFVPMFRNIYTTDSNSVIHYDEIENYMIHLMAKIKDCYVQKRELYLSKPISSYYGKTISCSH